MRGRQSLSKRQRNDRVRLFFTVMWAIVLILVSAAIGEARDDGTIDESQALLAYAGAVFGWALGMLLTWWED